MKIRTVADWIAFGQKRGFCGPPVCLTHDGAPTTAEEDAAWEDGDDACIHAIRPYANAEVKAAVEANHAPSVWRQAA